MYQFVLSEGKSYYDQWSQDINREEFKEAAKNLAAYLALRQKDLRPLQKDLIPFGLSSLGRLEAKTLPTLEAILVTLAKLNHKEIDIEYPISNQFEAGIQALDKETDLFFGKKPKEYRTRIMVTLPTEAAEKADLVDDMLEAGMNIARINCSHDNPETWLQMIHLVRERAKILNKNIKIQMDIAGPKLRVDWVFSKHKNLKVQVGDKIQLQAHLSHETENPEIMVYLGCPFPSIYKDLKIGDRIFFDDGSFRAHVIETSKDTATLMIDKVKGNSGRIKAEKGINFPDSDISVDIIDDKDAGDIAFACQHADIINMSFVRNKEDILAIQKEIEKNLGQDSKK